MNLMATTEKHKMKDNPFVTMTPEMSLHKYLIDWRKRYKMLLINGSNQL
jgi:hypothetical protein